jgi:hypothetical protein
VPKLFVLFFKQKLTSFEKELLKLTNFKHSLVDDFYLKNRIWKKI